MAMVDRPDRPIDSIVVHSRLNDGTAVSLRAITPDDEERIREGIAKLSVESRYLRFFSPAPTMPDEVIERLADVDGYNHIGWGAICTGCEDAPAIGAVHAVRYREGGRAGEYSIAVLDEFQGQGLARMLTAALLIQCLAEDMTVLDVHMLSQNEAARRLVKSLGATWKAESAGVVEYELDVAGGVASLRADPGAPGVEDVFQALAAV
jgi:RimJ/RimL family protein N-acetyltransferase